MSLISDTGAPLTALLFLFWVEEMSVAPIGAAFLRLPMRANGFLDIFGQKMRAKLPDPLI